MIITTTFITNKNTRKENSASHYLVSTLLFFSIIQPTSGSSHPLLRFGLYTLFFLPGHLEFVWQTAQPCAAHTHKHITRQCKQEKTVWKPYSIPPHQESAVYLASHPLLYAITYHHHCNHFCYFWPIVFDVMEKDYGFKQEGNSMGTRRRRRKSHPKKGSAKSESCFKLRP